MYFANTEVPRYG